MELYFAVSGSGAVLHTLNPRLHVDQLAYIIEHAEDRVVFFDLTFLPLIESVAPRVKSPKVFVAMTDRANMPQAHDLAGRLLCYEDLIDLHDDDFEWPLLDENSASSLCYTSGTTGNPKGVLYSHRSTVLHTYAAALPDAMNCSARDVLSRTVIRSRCCTRGA
jgi:fatty-acyl-CoA synthase